MKELIKIESRVISNGEIPTVNARDLHLFLEVGKVFGAWITERIDQFGFAENQDYVVISESGKNPQGGRPMKEYHLTIDMAKELSMVERNEKGKQARQYFIECERIAKNVPSFDPMTVLDDPKAMRGLLLTYTEKVIVLEDVVKRQAPKVEAFDRISMADGLTCITDPAKALQVRPKSLFDWLSSNRWIYRRPGGKGWIAYQEKIQQGLLFHKVTTVSTLDGREKVIENVLVTAKGLSILSKSMVEKVRQEVCC